MLESLQPFFDAIAKPELLKHQDRDVRLLVATCVCEITRITAPEAPYSDDILKVHSFCEGQVFCDFPLALKTLPLYLCLIVVGYVARIYFN